MKAVKRYKLPTSGQDGGIDGHTVPPPTTKRRTTTNLKTKKTTRTDRTVWKSDNQGVKEETFIHTGRRDRDGQLGRGLMARRWQLENLGE